MRDEKIRCAVLKYLYDEKKAGKEVVMDAADRVSRDYKIDIKRVFSVLHGMRNEGLVENVSRVATTTDMVITEKGISEYEEKCKHEGG